MTDIFISYKREDLSTARKLAVGLEKQGWSVWWDPKLQAGEDFEDAIEAALDDAKCIIVLWSARSVKSKFVKDEARYARDHNKLVPVAIEAVALPFRFRGIHTIQLVDWDGGQDSPGFQRLSEDITALIGRPQPGAGVAEPESERESVPATRQVDPVDPGQKPVTKTGPKWLLAGVAFVLLAGSSWFVWDWSRQRSAGESMAAIWENDGLAFCNQAIGGRYPIDRSASKEIKSADFIAFFGPGGKVDTFLNTLNTSDLAVALSPEAQQNFDRAKVVREVFFRGGGYTPAINFTLTPVTMDSTISRLMINLGGQRITYNHGPKTASKLQWPGPDWLGGFAIQVDPATPGAANSRRESGPWAWLRVLDKAEIKQASTSGTFNVRFGVGNRSASYRLEMTSVRNAFKLPALEEFECPATILE